MPLTGKKDDQITKLLRYDKLYQEFSQHRSLEEMQELCDQRDLEYGEDAMCKSTFGVVIACSVIF